MPPSSGRIAFVTGGTGFVGLNLVKELMIRGWDVTALDAAPPIKSDLTPPILGPGKASTGPD